MAELSVPFQTSYAASKPALCGYAQSLRQLRRYGIRTTLIQPGYIRTGIADKRPLVATPDSSYFTETFTVRAKVDAEHGHAAEPAIVACRPVRLSEHTGPLPRAAPSAPRPPLLCSLNASCPTPSSNAKWLDDSACLQGAHGSVAGADRRSTPEPAVGTSALYPAPTPPSRCSSISQHPSDRLN
jgi:hypothetical protein